MLCLTRQHQRHTSHWAHISKGSIRDTHTSHQTASETHTHISSGSRVSHTSHQAASETHKHTSHQAASESHTHLIRQHQRYTHTFHQAASSHAHISPGSSLNRDTPQSAFQFQPCPVNPDPNTLSLQGLDEARLMQDSGTMTVP